MSNHSTELPRVRVAVVLVKDGEVLLVRHRKGDRTYWLLPGGGLDYGETIPECAKRELLEETGLSIRPGRVLYMSEAIAPDKSRHILNLVLLAELEGGTLTVPDEAAIEEVAFKPFAALRDMTLHPPIGEELIASHAAGFAHDMKYLGSLWV